MSAQIGASIALPPHPQWGSAAEVYRYERTDGTACVQAKYRNGVDSPKHCAWWARGSDGQFYLSHGDVQLARLLPYRWSLLDNPLTRSEPIILCEGPRDAEALIGLGLIATDHRALVVEHVDWYRGRDIVIVADRDPPSSAKDGGGYRDHTPGRHTPGERHALKAAKLLRPVARRLAVVTMPGDGVKDAAQWVALQTGEPEGKAAMLRDLFAHALACAEPEASETLTYPLTEDGLALAFAQRYGYDLRFCHDAGRWYVWTGSRWQKEATRLAFNWAREICRDLGGGRKAGVAKASTAAAVERFAQADRAFAVTSALWDADPFLLGTPAGVVDLRTGLLRPAERTDHITKETAVAPDFGAERPLWCRFLDEATLGDRGLQRFLQQVAGYSLTGDVREHALFFIYGGGGNGKSVFLNVIAGLMADYATTAAMDTFVASTTDRHPTDLAMLQGARMVTAAETEEGRAWAEARIKALTGGDPIRARFMRCDFFEYRPQFKLLIVGNHRPVLRNVDDAARRRFNIIPFVHRPPVPDRQLEVKLRQEWPAILAWAIEGAIDWQQNGLVRPDVVADATDEYFAEQGLVRLWIEECCETGRRSLCDTSAALFLSWSTYAKQCGEQPGTRTWFGDVLRRLGYEGVKHTPSNHAKRGHLGIAVKAKDTSGQWQNRMEATDDALF